MSQGMPRLLTMAVLAILMFGLAAGSRAQTTDQNSQQPLPTTSAPSIDKTIEVPAGGFPGKGKYEDWLKANVSYKEGNALMDGGSYAKAIEKFKKAIATYPFDPDYHNNLGLAYKDNGNLQDAELAYKQSFALSPNWLSRANLCNVLEAKGDLAGAKRALTEALKLNPPDRVKADIQQEMADLDARLSAAAHK
jgi:tetratricopeptide (TPR) repeat protein